MIDKSAITAVFESLGPERVARGLANADGHTWKDCFLALAYGARGELERAIRRAPSGGVANLLRVAPKATVAADTDRSNPVNAAVRARLFRHSRDLGLDVMPTLSFESPSFVRVQIVAN